MLSNGDARTFKHLCDLNVYRDGVQLKTEECMNHVAKRLDTVLRKLTADGKKTGVTLSGRGYGKLTLSMITKLTGYCAKAVRSDPVTLMP